VKSSTAARVRPLSGNFHHFHANCDKNACNSIINERSKAIKD
jgi:hypothetical protein